MVMAFPLINLVGLHVRSPALRGPMRQAVLAELLAFRQEVAMPRRQVNGQPRPSLNQTGGRRHRYQPDIPSGAPTDARPRPPSRPPPWRHFVVGQEKYPC
ncbi:hypothetical protein GCM10027614_20800 [Micromonospora vulcania]